MEGLQLASHDHPQVYTAKDAAERVTLLLLSQEQEYKTGSIDAAARPDAQSYNEAIGTLIFLRVCRHLLFFFVCFFSLGWSF